jgi:hypothetical protein
MDAERNVGANFSNSARQCDRYLRQLVMMSKNAETLHCCGHFDVGFTACGNDYPTG